MPVAKQDGPIGAHEIDVFLAGYVPARNLSRDLSVQTREICPFLPDVAAFAVRKELAVAIRVVAG